MIVGGLGADIIDGLAGDDEIYGLGSADILTGGSGNDTLDGGAGNDTLNGGAGLDKLNGGDGNDRLNGDQGNDTFYFSAGTDTANGGNGTDTIILLGTAADFNIRVNNSALGNYTLTRLSDGSVTTTSSIESIKFEAPPASAVDDNLLATAGAGNVLNVLANDAPSGEVDVISATLRPGAEGLVSVGAAGDYIVYDLTDGYKSLGAGETTTAAIDYIIANTAGDLDGGLATITINGVDDTVGQVSDTDFAANAIIDNAAIGTAVGVTAHAADVDINDLVTYSLVAPTGEFAIDASTGIVTVAGVIDSDAGSTRTITVLATSTNQLGGTTTSQQTFTINIGAVDEFDTTTPVDADAATNVIAENITGIVGITASADDADITDTVTFSIVGDVAGHFSVDANTGVISVVSTFDREADGASVDVTVRATSTDGSFAEQTFAVAITDVDEFDVSAPVDIDETTGGSVTENGAAGVAVGITASTSDVDATTNGVTYGLSNDDGGRFTIDANTGVVATTGEAIDREAASERSIVVRALSADGSFSEQAFVISVGDVDEFDVSEPVDTDAAANEVAVSASAGTAVGITASASDADATTNGVTYSLLNATGEFAIDASTGIVTVAGAINASSGPNRIIEVLATSADGSGASHQFELQVTEAASPEVVSVYVLAGQSNAEREEVRYSIEAAFREKGEDFVLVVEAHGGRTLAKKEYYPDFHPDSENEYFDAMNIQIANTVAAIEASGKTAEIKGLLWVHGEADAGGDLWASSYEQNLQYLIDETRALYGDDLPFVVAELSSTHQGMTYRDVVRQAQYDVVAANENVFLLETGELTFLPDLIHYDTPGRVALAEAFVETVLPGTENAPQGDPDQTVTGTTAAEKLGGGSGNDTVFGNLGDDVLFGDAGSDVLYGDANNDILIGGSGNDVLYGGKNADSLMGGSGNDTLYAGAGIDEMTGGTGADLFVFENRNSNSHDTVFDFEDGVDKIVLQSVTVASFQDTANGAFITFANGADLLVSRTSVQSLTADDFVLQSGADANHFF